MSVSQREVGGLVIDDVTPNQFLKADVNKKVISSAVDLTTDITGVLPVANGGTNLSTFGGTNTVLFTTAPDTLSSLPSANTSVFTTDDSGAPQLTNTAPITSIIDNFTDNNEIMSFTDTPSAVNEVTVANAATTNGPTISATGDDANIDLNLEPKGTGNVNLSGLAYPNADGTAGQVLSTDGAGTLSFVSISIPITNSITLAGGAGPDTSTVLATATDTAYCIRAVVVGRLTSGANAGDSICLDIKASYKNVGGTVSRVGLVDDYVVNSDAGVTRTVGANMDAQTTASGTNVAVTIYGDATDSTEFTVNIFSVAT